MNIYESERLLSEYLFFHYGTPEEISADTPFVFPPASLEFPLECVRFFGGINPGTRALDVGCAVGRASFEFAACGAEVVGVDFSQSFIDTANRLKHKGSLSFQRTTEGERKSACTAHLSGKIERNRVTFIRADAMHLPKELGGFDYVLGANLLCRLSEPRRFLAQLPDLVKPAGLLVLTTPCSWMEDYTPRENWLAAKGCSTLDALRSTLEPHFTLLKVGDLPFVIREHARKFQCVNAQASLWQRQRP